MLNMGSQSGTVDQDIIQEYQNKLSEKRLQNPIHSVLESSWCISKSKWHYSKLKVSMMGFKGCIIFISLHHSDLMIINSHIQLCEILSSMKFIKDFFNDRQRKLRKSIFGCKIIKFSIVNTESPTAIFLLHQKDWGRKWTCAMSNKAGSK